MNSLLDLAHKTKVGEIPYSATVSFKSKVFAARVLALEEENKK